MYLQTAMRQYGCHAQTVRNNTISYKIDNVGQIKDILNPEGTYDCIIGLKVTVVLLDRAIRLYR